MEDVFEVKLETFEGPLDLLLSLIEKRKLFINDISLAKVADDFISYVEKIGTLPIATTAHFILVASTLLLIKSKSLLPSLPLTEEETQSIEDLELRLTMYKKFQELSRHIATRFGKKIIFSKNPSKNIPSVFTPDETINPEDMVLAIQRVIESLPKKEELPKAIVKKMISLEDMIGRLTERMQTNLKMSFGEFAQTQSKTNPSGSRHITTKAERVNIIVSFLAMLELVKQGIIDVSQNSRHEDIDIETKHIGVPDYHSL